MTEQTLYMRSSLEARTIREPAAAFSSREAGRAGTAPVCRGWGMREYAEKPALKGGFCFS